MPAGAGNNMPLRGCKSEIFEGGIRNNAFLRSKTLIPPARAGQRYTLGLVHIADIHASLVVEVYLDGIRQRKLS